MNPTKTFEMMTST